MCGIAGVVNTSVETMPTSAYSVVSGMVDLLSHRGPDGRGILDSAHATLGHARLSIIDPKNAHQPMKSTGGELSITFNGEIFNYRELKQECGSLPLFSSSGDTEAILAQFLLYREDSFSRLRGQFAFCLHEAETGVSYLVRDPMGEKPLYYYDSEAGVFFASEVKALLFALRSLGHEPRISPQAFSDFLSLNYVPGGNTLVEGIYALPPGHFLLCTPGKPIDVRKYSADEKADYVPNLRQQGIDVLSLAARRRTVSDVPIACLLSGGLDSSLALALAVREGIKCTAYTADFEDSRFSEFTRARAFTKKLGVEHHNVIINPAERNIENLIKSLAWHGDAPLADSSSCAVYLLSEQVGKSHKVALSGDGADELFGGYLTYQATRLSRLLPRQTKSILQFLLQRSAAMFSKKAPAKVGIAELCTRFARALQLPPGAAHVAWNGTFLAEEKMRLVNPSIIQEGIFFDTFSRLADNFFDDMERPTDRELLSFDQKFYLEGDILQKADRMGMEHGLEIRPFYLENEVVNYANSLPLSMCRNKAILREIMSVLCPWYKSSPKQGFSIPVHTWLRTVLRDYVEDVLFNRRHRVWDYLSMGEVRKMWDAHQKGSLNYGFELWGILMFSVWYTEVFSQVGVRKSLNVINSSYE
jgi:asparagine synthase (glutamine-hydrolysing)